MGTSDMNDAQPFEKKAINAVVEELERQATESPEKISATEEVLRNVRVANMHADDDANDSNEGQAIGYLKDLKWLTEIRTPAGGSPGRDMLTLTSEWPVFWAPSSGPL